MLREKLNNDLKEALKAGDATKVSTLRFLLSALHNAEIEMRPEGKELNDAAVALVVSKQINYRRESIEAYEKGGRKDLAEKEKQELAILQDYLPPQMSEEEVRQLVKEAIERLSDKELGSVMKAVMPQLKGRADGAVVRQIVEEELQK